MATLTPILNAIRREGLLVSGPDGDLPLTGISDDSRTILPGMLYIAVRGTQTDGHRFIPDAVRRGAAAIVVETPQGSGRPEIQVTNSRRAAMLAARTWFGDPASKLTLVAVTGTNGKTTTTVLAAHLFNAGGTAASIGTLGAFDGAGEPVSSTAGTLTTPGPVDLQATLAALVARGATHVAMEASSHSLDQGRLDDLRFAAGIFTNLTRDHLDYHRSMEAYLAAKLRLSGLLAGGGVEIVNADDSAWSAMPPRAGRVTYGTAPHADLRASQIQLDSAGSSFHMAGRWGSGTVRLPLLGDYNISNALGAAAAALALGHAWAEVTGRLAHAPQVPGRMELLAERPCVILRDYAHTPDALQRALETLRPLTRGRLIVVFGCGGDRDRGKRPVMGRIAAELGDVPVLTSDNPRTEDPEAIIDEVEAGMGGKPHHRNADRRRAIEQAVALARPGDTLLLAGKGHETYQVVGTEKLPFDERQIIVDLGAAG